MKVSDVNFRRKFQTKVSDKNLRRKSQAKIPDKNFRRKVQKKSQTENLKQFKCVICDKAGFATKQHMGQIPQDGKNEQYVALFFNF